MILTLRTESAIAEIGLYDASGNQTRYYTWQTDRNLAKELLKTLIEQLAKADATFDSLTGVVVYLGPGSFTGLRIGITVANTIAYGQGIPIVGQTGDDWTETGLSRLGKGEDDRIVLPHYGQAANISTPKR